MKVFRGRNFKINVLVPSRDHVLNRKRTVLFDGLTTKYPLVRYFGRLKLPGAPGVNSHVLKGEFTRPHHSIYGRLLLPIFFLRSRLQSSSFVSLVLPLPIFYHRNPNSDKNSIPTK